MFSWTAIWRTPPFRGHFVPVSLYALEILGHNAVGFRLNLRVCLGFPRPIFLKALFLRRFIGLEGFLALRGISQYFLH